MPRFVLQFDRTAMEPSTDSNEDREPTAIDPKIVRDNYLARKYAEYGNDRSPLSLPERVSQAAFRGADGGNLQAALAIQEGSLRSVRPEQGARGAKGRESFRQAVHAAEQRDYLSWAKAAGKLIDASRFNQPWERDGRRGESEHQVYYDPETGWWWKRNLLNFHDGSISAYLERLAAQKLLFPDLAPMFEGISTFDGQVIPVISQSDAVGIEPTDEEITEHLANLGFHEVFETGDGMTRAHRLAVEAGLKPPPLSTVERRIGFLLLEEGIWLEDVHGENAVVALNKFVNVFDPVTYFLDASKLHLVEFHRRP